MAWLYVPGSADLNSGCAESGPTSEQSAGASGTDTPLPSSCRECRRAPWTRLLSGTILAPSTATSGVASWISSLRATRASRSPSPDSGAEPTIPVTSGRTSRGSFARWDPESSSWKTSQATLFSGCQTFSGSWPRWGSMRSGAAIARRKSAHRTSGNGSSCWPTVVVNSLDNYPGASPTAGWGLQAFARHWPTARGEDSENCGGHRGTLDSLTEASRQWPTPVSSPNSNRKTKVAPSEAAGQHGLVLAAEAASWATPKARDQGALGPAEADRKSPGLSRQAPATALPGQPSSPPHQSSPLRLNPLFVEWLMGFPRNWSLPSVVTACAALETQWCQPRPNMLCVAS